MRALIVTNMYPSADRPALGSFVRDQVEALRRTREAQIEVFAFDPGGPGGYLRAARELHRRHGGERYDVLHSHFGLSQWPALAARGRVRLVTLHGTDLTHPRSRPITLAGLRTADLVAAVSPDLARRIPAWAGAGQISVLPCGVELARFRPIARAQARQALGLEPDRPYLLFPSDPRRPEKRHDLARAVAGDVPLLTLGNVAPAQVPLWINAANAVLVPSAREGYGLAVLEALACDVPVLATPVGIAPEALAGVAGSLCAPFALSLWTQALAPHLAAGDPRIAGRRRVERFSADRMAVRVLGAWRGLLERRRGR